MDSTTPLAGFRHQIAIQVRWGDMDALGHVNNARFLTYTEHARVDYVNTLKVWDGSASRLGMIMAKAVIDFRLPLFAGDDVLLFTRCARLGKSSFDMELWIARRKGDQLEIAAQATITVVVYDYSASRSTPIPDEWRAMIRAYEVAAPLEA